MVGFVMYNVTGYVRSLRRYAASSLESLDISGGDGGLSMEGKGRPSAGRVSPVVYFL